MQKTNDLVYSQGNQKNCIFFQFSFKIPGIKLWTLLAPSQRSDHNTSWYWTQIFQFEAITELSAELKN